MAAIALDVGILYARLWTQDTSTTLPGLTDANYTSLINDRYMTWHRVVEPRVKRIASFQVLANGEVEGVTSATSIVPEVLGLEISLTPLERMEYIELRALRVSDSTTGTPKRYALFKDAASEKWLASYHPIPDGSYTVTALVRDYPTALSGTGTPILGDAESYWLYRFAAADAAILLQRPELVEQILAPIPDNIRNLMGAMRGRLDPKRRPEEIPA
jgi:hypothetical protein